MSAFIFVFTIRIEIKDLSIPDETMPTGYIYFTLVAFMFEIRWWSSKSFLASRNGNSDQLFVRAVKNFR